MSLTDSAASRDSLNTFLSGVAQELPIIRPIKEFIHLNLLLPYQQHQFWDALSRVSEKLEAMPFADLKFYQDKIRAGELKVEDIEAKLRKLSTQRPVSELIKTLLEGDIEFTHHDQRVGKLHELWNDSLSVNIIQLADGILIKWLGMYVDQGIGLWQMPGSDTKGFYDTVKDLLETSLVRPSPFSKDNLKEFFLATPEETINEHLSFLCPNKELQHTYLRECIFTLRGWAGLIYCLENNPKLLSFPRKLSLIDFLAMKLVLEHAWILSHDHCASPPDFSRPFEYETNPLMNKDNFKIFRACQEALEETTYASILKIIQSTRQTPNKNPDFQAVFCMDDRESILRHHLEDVSPRVETLGTAGHFGIECLYWHSEDAFPKKQCPAPMPAKVLLKDIPVNKLNRKKRDLAHDMIQPSHTFYTDWLLTFRHAIVSTFELTINLFFPLAGRSIKNLREIQLNTELQLNFRPDAKNEFNLPEGYTLEQMSDLIYGQLQLIGFVNHFSPLIFIMGHGGNSVNNPYFAAYGCGACSGRQGSANSRAFCTMANNPEVRALIKEKYQLEIPSTTHFVAGFHDTTRDIVEIYNSGQIPQALLKDYSTFKRYLSIALYKNARGRSKFFKLVSFRPISKEAQKEVLRRSYSLFETRPELGHTNVVFSIVGRRSLTQGLRGLERRSFLQSYDRNIDPEGNLLAASLGAVIPVTSGINLDYYFSRVDNLRFGAGSKLPQNIVGNIGVSHGTESDLLFGLPFQMIDQHQPQRLMVLVEQSPEIALKAIQDNKLVREIVYNNWIYYACYDEVTKAFYYFESGKMVQKDFSNSQNAMGPV